MNGQYSILRSELLFQAACTSLPACMLLGAPICSGITYGCLLLILNKITLDHLKIYGMLVRSPAQRKPARFHFDFHTRRQRALRKHLWIALAMLPRVQKGVRCSVRSRCRIIVDALVAWIALPVVQSVQNFQFDFWSIFLVFTENFLVSGHFSHRGLQNT